MLIKLLKYDLKYMLKNMLIFYILAIFFSILTRIFFTYDNSAIMIIISQVSVGCMFSIIASILVNTLMRSWVSFRDSVYKDEAYLTHTLPVTKNQIYDSKLLKTLVFMIVSFIVVIISLFICYYTEERFLMLKDFIDNFTKSINFSVPFFITSIILIFFLEMHNMLECGYLGLILGYKKNNNKLGFTFIYGILSYLLSQVFVVLCVFIVGLFNSNIMDLFKNNIKLDPSTFKLLAILSIVIYLIINIVISFISKIVFNKGVNIE